MRAPPWDYADYLIDRLQRSWLLLDVLRLRGDQQQSMAQRPYATVLSFEYEMILDGQTPEHPINYYLLRVVPPPGTQVDDGKRPVVIVDPRAGQGPGIAGFHHESEIGDAFAAGHPVYFIGFSALPKLGQTFVDVVAGQVRFFEEVVRRHPNSPPPFAIGNCQAGYQTLMVTMMRPDLFGPVLLAGSPMSYWQGNRGQYPMRYAGGLSGGAWLVRFLGDLGCGLFDGGYLIGNFDNLNPGHTAFGELYDVFAKIDKETDRYLRFEEWWGDLVFLGADEITYLVEKHFVGDKLMRRETFDREGHAFDVRKVNSPIIVFTSLKDNISPPPQTLGWILDTYAELDDLRDAGQTVLYCVDPGVGHLAIFVSPKVARREHAVFSQLADFIDVVPPGLFEIVIEEVSQKTPGAGYVGVIKPRTFDDIRAFGRNSVADDRAFATAARVSEVLLASYMLFMHPLVVQNSQRTTAEALWAANPVRLAYTLFRSSLPWMIPVPAISAAVSSARAPARPENPFVAMEHSWANAVLAGFDTFSALRDTWSEASFFAFYGSPFVQALMGTARTNPRPKPLSRVEAGAHRNRDKQAARVFESGGRLEAEVRAVIYVLEGDQQLDERVILALEALFDARGRTALSHLKDVVRDQFLAVHLDADRSIAALPTLIPNRAEQHALLHSLREALSAAGPVSAATLAREQAIAQSLGLTVSDEVA
ncbi:MAG: DUF3141 domain-containing protein [Pseudomonadota bacterium]